MFLRSSGRQICVCIRLNAIFSSKLSIILALCSTKMVCRGSQKIQVVKNYRIPKTIKDVRAFLGLTNFFRKCVRNYATLCSPLYDLLQKDVKFCWTDTEENAFEALKQALTNAPVLALPNLQKDFILTCDASDIAISYNLSQIFDGQERIVSFGGRGLRDSE